MDFGTPFLHFFKYCLKKQTNKIIEVPEYAKMQFHRMTLLDSMVR